MTVASANVVTTNQVYESRDRRDTDPAQPNGLRRVKVTRVEGELAQVQNLTTGRRTVVVADALTSSKWKRING